MTIKALQGGKLLCLMAAVAGAMTLGSCSKDDDEPEPAPAPVPTPQKVTVPTDFEFRIKGATPDTLKDTIKAKTLLEKGVNTDTIYIDVTTHNNQSINSASVSLTLTNDYLKNVKVAAEPVITGNICSIPFTAIEGNYTLKINNETKNFVVAGSSKLSSRLRNLSNKYSVKLDGTNNSIEGIKFIPYSEVDFKMAHLEGNFIALSDSVYQDYLLAELSHTKTVIEESPEKAKPTLSLKDRHFVYIGQNKNIYICNIVGDANDNSTNITLEITY